MKKYIGITGSCATGKSTRVNKLVDHLGEPLSQHEYTFSKNNKEKTIQIGNLYEGGLFIAGKKAKSGHQWIGADYVFGELGSKALILPMIADTLTFADTFLIEGYFGVGSKYLRAKSMQDLVQELDNYYFLYDNLQEYIERTEGRTGKTWEQQGKDPETSAGWRSNKGFKTSIRKANEELAETGLSGKVIELTKDEDEDYFIKTYLDGLLTK